MSNVSMQQVKELRDRTQAGLNDCKSALVESAGDMEKAVEVILKKGLAKSAKRAGSVATEGAVAVQVAADGKSGIIAEVNIQTDFAARNDDFKAFVGNVMAVATKASNGADLGNEAYPGGGGTVEDVRKALVGKLGENITVRRWGRLTVDGPGKVISYVHMGGKIGVLLAVRTDTADVAKKPEVTKFAEDAAMQIAAMSPLHLTSSEVPQAEKAKQGEIFEAQMREMEKAPPEKAWPKIIEGKVQKWVTEITLLEQPSVIETDKTVDQLRQSVAKAAGGTVDLVGFIRYQLGEGVEAAKGPDFADEVAKMAGG
ncbi:MAG TPA: translation elongation factor Ts [Polyangiaceae bacterium]|jgi:elongation factor Ts|nr:translation elongation factor Ts [Polyangiaceae bacterium]